MIIPLVLAFVTSLIIAAVFYLIGFHRGVSIGKAMGYLEATGQVLDKINKEVSKALH